MPEGLARADELLKKPLLQSKHSAFDVYPMSRRTMPTAQTRQLSTLEKALEINLDTRRYGNFAEIGAGQEVARWFFQAGGAAGTISKSISAYDLQVSDDICGKSDRYVGRRRLEATSSIDRQRH